MAIKVNKNEKLGKQSKYKSSKKFLTPQDIQSADVFDADLEQMIKGLETVLLKQKVLSLDGFKKDPLKTWYLTGKHINAFLKKHRVDEYDEKVFWNYLYGRSALVHKGIPTSKISQTRNDFKIATQLSKYPFRTVKEVGTWALWREILGYRIFLDDKRLLKLLVDELIKSSRTRDEIRPLLKALSSGLKKIDTSVLSDKELLEKSQKLGLGR